MISAQRFNSGWRGDAGVRALFSYEYASTRDADGHGSHTGSTEAIDISWAGLMNSLSQLLGEIHEWPGFAIESKKVELYEQMKALLGSADFPDLLACKNQSTAGRMEGSRINAQAGKPEAVERFPRSMIQKKRII